MPGDSATNAHGQRAGRTIRPVRAGRQAPASTSASRSGPSLLRDAACPRAHRGPADRYVRFRPVRTRGRRQFVEADWQRRYDGLLARDASCHKEGL